MTTDAEHRAETGLNSNPACPDHSSHWENVFDLALPSGMPAGGLTDEQWLALDTAAEAEYQACEGH